MSTASLTQGLQANRPLRRSCEPVSTNVRAAKITSEIIRICRAAIGLNSFRKTVANRAKCSLGTIDNWIASNRVVDVERLLNMFEGPQGPDCFNAFLAHVPETTREHWIQHEILRRKLEARAAARLLEDAELAQLQMSLNEQKR